MEASRAGDCTPGALPSNPSSPSGRTKLLGIGRTSATEEGSCPSPPGFPQSQLDLFPLSCHAETRLVLLTCSLYGITKRCQPANLSPAEVPHLDAHLCSCHPSFSAEFPRTLATNCAQVPLASIMPDDLVSSSHPSGPEWHQRFLPSCCSTYLCVTHLQAGHTANVMFTA